MIHKSLSLAALLALAGLLPACKQESKEIRTRQGATITVVESKADADRTKQQNLGQVMTLHVTYRNGKDSVFHSTHREGPAELYKLYSDTIVDPFSGASLDPITAAFNHLVAGDSALIVVSSDSIFKGPMEARRPPFLPKGSPIKASAKVISVQTQENLDSMRKAEIKKYVDAHPEMHFREIPGGTYISISEKGTGDTAKVGSLVQAHYRGHILNSEKIFDESYMKGQPLSFAVGSGQMIQGWDQAFLGLPQGTKFNVIVPYQMGFGAQNIPRIPAYSTLQFETELIKVEEGKKMPGMMPPMQ